MWFKGPEYLRSTSGSLAGDVAHVPGGGGMLLADILGGVILPC